MYATEKQLQLRVTKRVAKPYNTMPHHVASNPGPLFHGIMGSLNSVFVLCSCLATSSSNSVSMDVQRENFIAARALQN